MAKKNIRGDKKTNALLTAAAGVVCFAGAAANGADSTITWTAGNIVSGSWNNSANWSGSVVPNDTNLADGTDIIASLTSFTAGKGNISLDSGVTVGRLWYNWNGSSGLTATAGINLSSTNGSVLMLARQGGTPQINVGYRFQPTSPNANVTIGVSLGGTQGFTVAQPSGQYQASGLILTGDNTVSGPVSGYTLMTLKNGNALKNASLELNGTLSLKSDADTTFATHDLKMSDYLTTIAINVDQSASGSGHLLKLGGNMATDNVAAGAHTKARTLNITGGNGYSLEMTGDVSITTAAASPLTIDTSANATISGAVGSTQGAGLTKMGTAVLMLTGANTYTGATNISGGTLQIGNGGTTGSLSTSSTITNDGALVFKRSNTITQGANFAGSIGGNGGVTQAGSGTLILAGNNTYAGPTNISGGTLQIGNGSTTGKLSTGSAIVNNGALIFNRSNAVAQGTDFSSAAITGSGGLTQAGGGSLTLNAANGYLGATNVTGGTLVLGIDNAIPSTSNVSITGSTLALGGHSAAVASLALSNGTISGLGRLSAGNLTSGGTSSIGSTVNISGGSTVTSGTLTFTGSGSISSPITITGAGHVVYNSTAAPIGMITVATGTTLSGTGTVGAVTVDTGGHVAPGNSPGTINTGAFTLAGTLDAEVNGVSAYDQVNVTGGVDLNGSTLNFILGYAPTIGDSYKLINNDNTDAVGGIFTGLPQAATFDTTYDLTTYRFRVDYAGGLGANDVVVTNVSIPEPSTVAMVLGFSGLLAVGRRRRQVAAD